MARNQACRPAKMQTCLWCGFNIAFETCGVKGAFAEPWAQLSQPSDLSSCQKMSQCIHLLSLPSWAFAHVSAYRNANSVLLVCFLNKRPAWCFNSLFHCMLSCSKAALRRIDVAVELVLLVSEHPFHLQLQIMIQLADSSPPHLKWIRSPPSINDCYPKPTVWRVFRPDGLQHFPWAARLQEPCLWMAEWG